MANFATYRQNDYSGGLNNTSSNQEIERNEASKLENWDISVRGRLTSRKGIDQLGDTQSNTLLSLGRYKSSSATQLLLQEGVNINYLNSNTFANIDTVASAQAVWFENCPTNNRIYLASEDNVLSYWTGTGTLTKAAASVPHGNVLKWFKNHMFQLNNVNISGTKYTNRVYISDFGDPSTWGSSNYIELPGEGKAMTANLLGDYLVIFKENSYMFLTGYGVSSWTIDNTSTSISNTDVGVGCVAPRGTVRVSANELWFIDNQGLIRRVTQTDYGYNSNVLSRKIQGTIDNINKSQLSKAVAWINEDKVYFAVPYDTSTVNNYVLVHDLKARDRTNSEAWTLYTNWTIQDAITYETNNIPETVIADYTNKKVYRHTGYDDDGEEISCQWDGKADDYDKSERYKKYAYGYIYSDNQGNLDVDIYSSIDGAGYSKIDTFNMQGSGSTLGPTGSFLLGPTGDGRLAGGEGLEEKYYFADGGQSTITGKYLSMSLRCSTTSKLYVNNFTNHFIERSLR
jgi:hypothetical protein